MARTLTRAPITEGLGPHRRRHENYHGYMNGQYEDHARPRAYAAEVTDRVRLSNDSRAVVPGHLQTSYTVAVMILP